MRFITALACGLSCTYDFQMWNLGDMSSSLILVIGRKWIYLGKVNSCHVYFLRYLEDNNGMFFPQTGEVETSRDFCAKYSLQYFVNGWCGNCYFHLFSMLLWELRLIAALVNSCGFDGAPNVPGATIITFCFTIILRALCLRDIKLLCRLSFWHNRFLSFVNPFEWCKAHSVIHKQTDCSIVCWECSLSNCFNVSIGTCISQQLQQVCMMCINRLHDGLSLHTIAPCKVTAAKERGIII